MGGNFALLDHTLLFGPMFPNVFGIPRQNSATGLGNQNHIHPHPLPPPPNPGSIEAGLDREEPPIC